jgi:uncharacterized protein YrrD
VSLLVRGKEVLKRPVVTLDGEDVAQVKDVVYAPDGGSVVGFTLAGRGLFAGPRSEVLSWSSVHALGRDAVMISGADALGPPDQLDADADDEDGGRGARRGRGGRGGRSNVLGARVLTDDGTDIGEVVDVVLQVDGAADVVGYELEASAALGTEGRKVLVPLPDTLAVSDEALIVPAAATEYVAEDLSGFGAAVEAFRRRLRGERS